MCQSMGSVGRLDNISQLGPNTAGQPFSRRISAALVGVRCKGAAIDCASGVHMGAGIRAAQDELCPPMRTKTNANAAKSRDNRQGLMKRM